MLSKYLKELYNNNNWDPDPTQNPNEKFWNPEPGPEPGLIIFWTLDPYPNPQYQFCKTQKPDPPLNFIGFSSLIFSYDFYEGANSFNNNFNNYS